jgi:small-conductance mechanosensitive channel
MNPLILKDPAPAFYFTDFEGQSGKQNINCWVVTENYSLVHRELSNAIFPWIEPIPQNS